METSKKRGGLKTPIQEVVLIPQIAAQLALGKSTTEIAQALNVGFNTVRRLAGKEETKAVVKEIADGYKDVSKAYCMKAITEMNELSMDGLKKALKDGNVQAIRTHLQVIGLIGVEEAKGNEKAGAPITVVLPGAKVESVIEVSNGTSSSDIYAEGSEDSDGPSGLVPS